jgi:hypothetical protein
VFIAGGPHQGLKPGDHLTVMQSAGSVHSDQTGFDITLPPTRIADIIVDSSFGQSETDEGSIAHVISGRLPAKGFDRLFVVDGEAP